ESSRREPFDFRVIDPAPPSITGSMRKPASIRHSDLVLHRRSAWPLFEAAVFLLLGCSSGSDDTQNTGAGDTSFGPGGLTESTSVGGTAIGGVDGTTTGTVTTTSATGNATATSATGI